MAKSGWRRTLIVKALRFLAGVVRKPSGISPFHNGMAGDMIYASGMGMATIPPGTIRRVSAKRDSALPCFPSTWGEVFFQVVSNALGTVLFGAIAWTALTHVLKRRSQGGQGGGRSREVGADPAGEPPGGVRSE